MTKISKTLYYKDMNETDRKLYDEITNKYKQLAELRKPWESTWQDISRFVNPKRVDWSTETGTTEAKRATEVYSSTAISALDLMCNGLIGYLVSRTTPWIRLKAEDTTLMQYPEVRQYFQDVEEQLYSEFNRSNFYDIMSELFHDAGSTGTACAHVDEDYTRERVNFTARHPKEVYLADDRYGVVDTVVRRYTMTAKQIIEEFSEKQAPGEGNILDEAWINENKERLYKKFNVIHAIYPREDRDTSKDDNLNKRYASVYILEGQQRVLRNTGLDEMCDIVWRWDKNTDEVYGRSPAWNALADILRDNRIAKDLLRLGEYTVNPAIQYPGRIEYRLSLMPGGKNPYRDPNELIQPIKLGDYPVGNDRELRLTESIKDAFFVDFFLGLQEIQKTMTVPEVMERQSEKATVLSAAVGRINSELLDPMIDKTFAVATEAGRMPVPPDILWENGARVKIEYIGPLAQVLQRNFATQGIRRSLENVLPYIQLFPGMADLINEDELAKQMMISSGMPEKVIRKDDEVAQIRQARAMQQQAMMQQQALESMGRATGGLNQKPVEGSILSEIAGENRSVVNGADVDGQI